MLVIWIPLSGGVLFGVERLYFESKCGGSDGDLREFQMFYMFKKKNIKSHFLCFLMQMIRMPETAKIRITTQAKDLYIADDVLYYVLD